MNKMAYEVDLNYTADIMQKLYEYSNENFQTDFKIRAGNKTAYCHAAVLSAKSTYFRAICASGLTEAVLAGSITKDEDGDTLDTVVRYIYLGKSNITVQNVEKVAIAANFLGHEELKHECEKILLDNLGVSKLMSHHKLSQKADMSTLKAACIQLTKENFTEVVGCEWFLALTVDEAAEYLRDNDLNVTSEDDVLHAICTWLKNSNETSTAQGKHSDKLFPCVHLKFCQRSTLDSLSKDATIVDSLRLKLLEFLHHGHHREGEPRKSYSATHSVSAASAALPRPSLPGAAARDKPPPTDKAATKIPPKASATPSSPSAKLPVTSSQKVKEEVLIVGGRKPDENRHENIVFLDRDPKDCIMTHAPICSRARNYSACANNNTLIVSGGDTKGFSVSKVQKFCTTDHRWVELPDLPLPADCHGSSYVGEKLYTFGGRFRENAETKHRYSSVNVLDLASLSWAEEQSLPIAVSEIGIAVVEEHIYALGGYSGKEWSRQTIKLNTRTGKTTQCQSMPKRVRVHNSAVTFHQQIYVLDKALFAQYDVNKDQWMELQLPLMPFDNPAMVLKQNHLIMLGGYEETEKNPSDVIQEYELSSKTWSLEPRKMPLQLCNHWAFVMDIPQPK